MSGGVENVTVVDSNLNGCGDSSFRIKAAKGRGGYVKDIYYFNS